MMIATGNQMKNIDETTIEKYGIPGIVLMESAGAQIVNEAVSMLGGDVAGKIVWIFCGGGNNGGDGFVVARRLHDMDCRIRVLLTSPPSELMGDVRRNYDVAKRMGIEVITVMSHKDNMALKIRLPLVDLVVDAIFGTGLGGEIRGDIADIIRLINDSRRPVLSVDLPSGLHPDTGIVQGICVQADRTVTLALPKPGLCLNAGDSPVGKLVVVDIGIPKCAINDNNLNHFLITQKAVAANFPVRAKKSHKGDYGHLLIAAGSRGYAGAASLVAAAATRCGTGLCTLAVPESLIAELRGCPSEAMLLPLPGENGRWHANAADRIMTEIDRFSAIAIGPGLGSGDNIKHSVEALIRKATVQLILDADALNAIAGHPEILLEAAIPPIITPHPGELSRLTGFQVDEINLLRIDIAREYAEKWNSIILLKGDSTVIGAPDGRIFINLTGNPGMATGGSGDVLTGMLGSFCAQGMDSIEAACSATYLHGLAGDIAAEEIGEISMRAGDIADMIPKAFFRILNG